MSNTLTRKERIEREKRRKEKRNRRKAGINAKRFWIENASIIDKEKRT